jgi:tetratricopeptide (TPR) repeat protein
MTILLILFFANSNFAATAPSPRDFKPVTIEKAGDTFHKALDEFSMEKFKDAAKHFMQVYTDKTVPNDEKNISLYNAALSHERDKQYNEAITGYKKLIENRDSAFLYKDTYYRISACCTETKNWACIVTQLNKWKSVKPLTLSEEFEFRIRIGAAYTRMGSYKDSTDYLETALKVLKNNKKFLVEDAITLSWDEEKIRMLGLWGFEELAISYKELGNQLTLQGKEDKNSTTLINMLQQKVELKSYYYLKSEDTYIDMIAYGDRESATKGIYSIGMLYESVYDDFKKCPIPESIKEKKLEKEYNEELEKILEPLLAKADIAYKRNIELGKEHKFSNQWIEKSITRRRKPLKYNEQAAQVLH